ncbi:hypothetical protein [Thermocrispum municipale]|nr:hypothetical protein [Thermocrispum municipale]
MSSTTSPHVGITVGDVLRLADVVVAGSLLSGAVATEAGVRPCRLT